jgi:hypothetical protein
VDIKRRREKMINRIKVMRIVHAVKFEKIRTKRDLKNCGCDECKEALKILNRM